VSQAPSLSAQPASSTEPASSTAPVELAILARLATGFGVAATSVSAVLSWNPSYWGDEAATVMSAQRPLASLWLMLGQVDAVHGLYYFAMHFWIRLFGASEFAVRFPSAIATGVAAAGCVVLAGMLAGRRVAIIAGVIAVVLPRFTAMGVEGRSYALSATVAVWITVLFIWLLAKRQPTVWGWATYALLAALGIYLFLYLALLIVAHAAFLALDRGSRWAWRAWATAALSGIALATPVLVAAVQQRGQVAFLAYDHQLDAYIVLLAPWFGGVLFSVVAWPLMLFATVRLVRVRRTRGPQWRLGLIVGLWAVVPALVLLVVSLAILPLYNIRYLTFCAPAAVVLLAVGVDALPREWARVTAVAALVALAVPSWISERGEFAKDGGSDWRQVSAFIATRAIAGEGIFYDDSTAEHRRPRLASHLYAADYRGLVDVALTTPFIYRAALWDDTAPLSSISSQLAPISRLLVVNLAGSPADTDGAQQRILSGDGFRLIATTHLHRTTIYEYSR
jgi:mannosyltransferase